MDESISCSYLIRRGIDVGDDAVAFFRNNSFLENMFCYGWVGSNDSS